MNKTNETGTTWSSHINVTPRFADRQTRQGVFELIKPQSGRSMIEMLGVLAIIGVLSVGGIMGYSKAMQRYKINKTIEFITIVANNIRTTFSNQGNYEDLGDDEVWKKTHIFPYGVDEASDKPIIPWEDEDDCDFTIMSYQKNSADTNQNKAFSINYWNVNLPETCIDLVTHDWRNAQVKMIEISGQRGWHVIPPISIDDAVKMCVPHTDSYNYGNIYLNWDFEIDTSSEPWKSLIDASTAALSGS